MFKIYEPITDKQIQKIHATVKERGIPDEELYAMIEDLILIPSISSLSKQEACFIIDKLVGREEYDRPPRCRTENDIPGGDSYPTMKQIWGIRYMVRDICMDREHFKAWRKKYRHITIRQHNRKQASDTFNALKKILAHKSKKKPVMEKGNSHVIH